MENGNRLSSELFWYRVMLCVAIVAIPLYGLLVKVSGVQSHEYMSHRLILSGACAILIVTSFFSHWVKIRLVAIACWLTLVLNLWALWITYVNQFSLDYMIGLFTTFCALNITARRPKLYFAFTSITVIATIAAVWICAEPLIKPGYITFASIGLGVAFMMTSITTLHYEKKLSNLNATLEKKVDERTAEAEEHAKQLVIKNRDLEQFAYIASHDLKSPLRNISSFIQLIQRKLKNFQDKDLNEYLSYVVEAVKKMNTIIDDVLLFSRYGDKSLLFQEYSLRAIIHDASILVNREIRNKHGVVQMDISADEIVCDKNQLEQLFRNLLENGLKYNTSAAPAINISMIERDAEYLFSVRDNGIGIAEEYHSKIFTMFQRLHSDREYSGTGIGLAICKRIVENHQGKIWVQSNPDGGSTFFFTVSKNLSQSISNLVLSEAMN